MSAEKPKQQKSGSELPRVDCSNDRQMVREGIRVPILEYNSEWHRKTPEERALLKKVSKIKGLRASAPPTHFRTIPHRITVHLKNLKKNPLMRTTVSDILYDDQIYDYLQTFFGHIKEEVKVIYFNGKNITKSFVL